MRAISRQALRILSVAAFAATFGSACTVQKLDDEWQVILEERRDQPLAIEAVLPTDGAVGIGRSVRPYVYLNRPTADLDQATYSVQPTSQPNAQELSPTGDFDEMAVRFSPASLIEGREYDFAAAVPDAGSDLVASGRFSTAWPEGLFFNMSTGLRAESFGSDPLQAGLLTALFDPGVYPLWLLQLEGVDASTDLPRTTTLRFGPAYIRESTGTFRIYREFGLSTALADVELGSDGSFSAETDSMFLPLDNVNGIILLYLDDVVLSGRLMPDTSPARIEGLRLEGVLQTRWLRVLSQEGAGWRTAVNGCSLDVDSNGNGVNDSATFVLTSNPEAIPVPLLDL